MGGGVGGGAGGGGGGGGGGGIGVGIVEFQKGGAGHDSDEAENA